MVALLLLTKTEKKKAVWPFSEEPDTFLWRSFGCRKPFSFVLAGWFAKAAAVTAFTQHAAATAAFLGLWRRHAPTFRPALQLLKGKKKNNEWVVLQRQFLDRHGIVEYALLDDLHHHHHHHHKR